MAEATKSITEIASGINSKNVGRIAERIVANELEAHGFRVTDLNKEGLSANADLLAVGNGKTWQIQVKGATNSPKEKCWFGYGYCTQEHIDDRKQPMFNRRESFYTADIVVLVAVRSPADYKCVILRTSDAEKAAQLNLDGYYRTAKRDGSPHRPGKVWRYLQPAPLEGKWKPEKQELARKERKILNKGLDAWDSLNRSV